MGCIYLVTDIGRSYAAEDSSSGSVGGDWFGSLGGCAERSPGRAQPSAGQRPGAACQQSRQAQPLRPRRLVLIRATRRPSSSNCALRTLRRSWTRSVSFRPREPTIPQTTGLLLGKVTHREPEVRKAALEALVQLNDTNAIPGLEQATSLIEDPREKVTLMDAVSYLKLPGVTDGAAPELADASSYPTSAIAPRKVVPNPRFLPGGDRQGRRQTRLGPGAVQPVPPANAGQTQPVPAPPDAAPPASPAPDTAPPPDNSPPQ